MEREKDAPEPADSQLSHNNRCFPGDTSGHILVRIKAANHKTTAVKKIATGNGPLPSGV